MRNQQSRKPASRNLLHGRARSPRRRGTRRGPCRPQGRAEGLVAHSCSTWRTLARQPCYHSCLIKGTTENQTGRATCSKPQSQQLREQESRPAGARRLPSSAEKGTTGTPLGPEDQTSRSRGVRPVPGRGAKAPHAMWHSRQIIFIFLNKIFFKRQQTWS